MLLKHILLPLALICSAACAQQPPASSPPASAPPPSVPPASIETRPTKNNGAPCVQPAPLLRLSDYNGPLQKVVGALAEKLEVTSLHQPKFQPGVVLCSLAPKDKFILFVRDLYNPGTLFVAGFNAGIGQGTNQDPSFGQGAAGYGKRYGTDLMDEASFSFFKYFAYPTVCSEDPRYYRLGQGGARKRILHATTHFIVAHHDDGTPMPNISEWLGTTSAVALSNLYHPGNRRGAGPTAEAVTLDITEDIGLDVLREFWPEITRKFRLPFRE